MRLNCSIAATYRCNLHCKYCYQLFDLIPCDDASSDVTGDDVVESGRRIREAGIEVFRLKISGGEPFLNPNLVEIVRLARKHWRPVKILVYSSGLDVGTKPRPVGKLKILSPAVKMTTHEPMLVSPRDLGLRTEHGVDSMCKFQSRCGMSFDAFGFTPCIRARSLGRLLGFSVHRPLPVTLGNEQLCEHCLYSLKDPSRAKIITGVLAGEIGYPSKTFGEALERRKAEGFAPVERFLK